MAYPPASTAVEELQLLLLLLVVLLEEGAIRLWPTVLSVLQQLDQQLLSLLLLEACQFALCPWPLLSHCWWSRQAGGSPSSPQWKFQAWTGLQMCLLLLLQLQRG